MNDKRREILIGYLLGALEPQESAKIDAEMQNHEDLRNDLALLCREISPINEIADCCEPPVGLAARTCQNLWSKIDSSQNSHFTDTLHYPKSIGKKRKITVVVSQNDHAQEEQTSDFSLQVSDGSPLSQGTSLEPQDFHPETAIPLSQALLLAPSSPPGKPNKILRRVDPAAETSGEPHLLLADSMVIVKNHPPKHYGRKSKDDATKIKRPWTTRDVFASLLVGLTAAVVIFPLIQMGIRNFSEMIIQQKLQNVANSMAPNTSQYSYSGLSPNDARIIITNIDSQTASALHNQRQNMPDPFADFLESPGPTVHPVHLSSEPATWQVDSTTPDGLSGGGDSP